MTGKVEERYTPSPGFALFVFTELRSSSRTLVPAGTRIVGADRAATGAASAGRVAEAVCVAAGTAAGVVAGAGEVAAGVSCAAVVRLPARARAVRARRKWVINGLRENPHLLCNGRVRWWAQFRNSGNYSLDPRGRWG